MAKRINILYLVVCAFVMIVSCQNSTVYIGDESAVIAVQTEYNGKWGMVGVDGKTLFSDEFKHEPSAVSDGLFSVQEGVYFAVYSVESNPRLLEGCDDLVSVGQFKEDVIPVTHENNRITLVDGKGKIKCTLNPINGKEIVECSPYCNESLFVIKDEDNKYGYVDKSGNLAISPIFDHASLFSDGVALARISDNGQQVNIVIDRSGKELFRLKKDMYPESDSFKHGLLKTRNSDDTWGFIDVNGVFIKAKGNVKRIGEYTEESFIFMNNDFLWGVMSINGELLIRPSYSSVSYLPNGQYLVHTDNEYFVLDGKGNRTQTIDGYDEVFPVNVGLVSYVAKDLSTYKFLKSNGKPVSDKVYYGIGRQDHMPKNVVSDYFSYDSIVEELIGPLSDGAYGMCRVNIPVKSLKIVNYATCVNTRLFRNDEEIKKGWKYELEVSILADEAIAFYRNDGYGSKVVVNPDAKVETIQILLKTDEDCWKMIEDKLKPQISAKGYKLIDQTYSSLDFKGSNCALSVRTNPSGDNIVMKIESILGHETDNVFGVDKYEETPSKIDKLSKYDAKYFRGKTGYNATRSGLKYVTVVEGSGASPESNDNVMVHYTGRLLDGTIFDSSLDKASPPIFPLKSLIKGWREALQLMKEGGVAVFYIPSNLAYGESGAPGTIIGPNADLIFELQLIGIE